MIKFSKISSFTKCNTHRFFLTILDALYFQLNPIVGLGSAQNLGVELKFEALLLQYSLELFSMGRLLVKTRS